MKVRQNLILGGAWALAVSMFLFRSGVIQRNFQGDRPEMDANVSAPAQPAAATQGPVAPAPPTGDVLTKTF